MLGKASTPVTGKSFSGEVVVPSKSPRRLMGFKTQSPRGLKNLNFGGVGIGIVAALEKTGEQHNTALFRRSSPIPVTPRPRNSLFQISPVVCGGEVTGSPVSDFLSNCNLCHKKLHGKDVYIYRGEKAFCSTECRYKHIVMDERRKKCGMEAMSTTTTMEVSGSPYANGQIFATGIMAM